MAKIKMLILYILIVLPGCKHAIKTTSYNENCIAVELKSNEAIVLQKNKVLVQGAFPHLFGDINVMSIMIKVPDGYKKVFQEISIFPEKVIESNCSDGNTNICMHKVDDFHILIKAFANNEVNQKHITDAINIYEASKC